MTPDEVIERLKDYGEEHKVEELKPSKKTLNNYVSWGLVSEPQIINKGRGTGMISKYPKGVPGEFFAAWNLMHGVYSPKLSKEEIVVVRKNVNSFKVDIFEKYIPETLIKIRIKGDMTDKGKSKRNRAIIFNMDNKMAEWIINEARFENKLPPNKTINVSIFQSRTTGEKRVKSGIKKTLRFIDHFQVTMENERIFIPSDLFNTLQFIDLDTNNIFRFISLTNVASNATQVFEPIIGKIDNVNEIV